MEGTSYNGVPIKDMYELWTKVQAEEAERRLKRMESMRRARAKYREEHKEEHREQNQAYYERHRDEILGRRRGAVQASG